MADATRNVKIRFDGETAGLTKASAEARAQLKAMQKQAAEYNRAVIKMQKELDARAALVADAREKRFALMRKTLATATTVAGTFFSQMLLGLSSLNGGIGILAGVAAWASQASGALLLIPAAIGVGAAAMLTFKLGADGIKAAFEGLNPTLDTMKAKVSDTFRVGLAPAVRDLNTILPQTTSHFQGIAAAASSSAVEFTQMLRNKTNTEALNATLDNSAGIVRNIGKALAPLGQAFLDLASVGSSVLKRLTDGAGGLAQRFADFIRNAKDTGQLESWMQGGIEAFKDLWGLLKDVGGIIGDVFSALREGGAGVAPILGPAIQTIRDFVQSPQGQETFKTLGEALAKIGDAVSRILGPALKAVAPLIEPFAGLLGDIGQILADTLGPALERLGEILKPVFDALAPVIRQLIEGLAPIIPVIVQSLGPLGVALVLLAPAILALNIPIMLAVSGLSALALLMRGDVSGAMSTMQQGWTNANNTMKTITDTNWGGMAEQVMNATSGMKTNVFGATDQMKGSFANGLMGMQNSASSGFGSIGGMVRSGLGNMVSAIGNGIREAVSWFVSLPGKILGALGDLGSRLFQSGASLIGGFINGITSRIGQAVSAVGGVLSRIRGMFPFSPAKEGPFSGRGWTLFSGMSIAESLGDGIDLTAKRAIRSAQSLTAGLRAALPAEMTAGISANVTGLLTPVPQSGIASTIAAAQARTESANSAPQILQLDLDLGAGITQRIEVEIDKNNEAVARQVRTNSGGYR
ncbi:hypothetical protein ACIA2T_19670 [Amycolatopsis japonica]|uniref:hypothetical protein n=1 Tax=Amycolatopsis japonica TaxID=208439 RepID=UPI0037B26872